MKPDLLSEVLLLCCGIVIVAAFVLTIVAAFTPQAALP